MDSLHAFGDYDDSVLFGWAAAKVVESFYRHYRLDDQRVVLHANEWQTASAALVIQKLVPQVATIFTTHATCIGRSIAGNNKPLYDYLWAYNGDQMAQELNMESKHSIEKSSPPRGLLLHDRESEITAREVCRAAFDKPVDNSAPQWFRQQFRGRRTAVHAQAQDGPQAAAGPPNNALLGTQIGDEALIVSTSGRYEFRNKGLGVFIEGR